MQIQITQDDLEVAVQNYMSEMGIDRPIEEITFSMGRNPVSYSASIELAPLKGTRKATTPKVTEPVVESSAKAAVAEPEKEEVSEPDTAPDGALAAVAEEEDSPLPDDTQEEEAEATGSNKNSLFG